MSSLTTVMLWERPTPSPASQPRRALNGCTSSERLHSGRGGVAESKIQPLLRDQSLAGQFGPLRQNVRATPRAVLAWLAAHGFQPDLVCKSHWTAGKVGVRAHGGWDHEMFARDLGWSVFQCVAVPLVAQNSEMAAQKSEMSAKKANCPSAKIGGHGQESADRSPGDRNRTSSRQPTAFAYRRSVAIDGEWRGSRRRPQGEPRRASWCPSSLRLPPGLSQHAVAPARVRPGGRIPQPGRHTLP